MGVFFQGREKILGIARKINSLQRQYGIQTAVDYEEEFKFNLMEVVFEWARGMVNMFINQLYNKFLLVIYGPLWPWSYGILIYNLTYVINTYHYWCYQFKSWSGHGVQHYVIKFVGDLRQVGGFLRVSFIYRLKLYVLFINRKKWD